MKIKNKTYYFAMGAVASIVITSTVIAFADVPSTHIMPLTAVREPNAKFISSEHTIIKPAYEAKIAQQCQMIHWIGNRVYTIKGSMNMATHFVFPEPSVDVIVGNKDLWVEEHKLNHVFVKPNTNKSDGSVSTLTYIGESNTSYEFILKRVPDSEAVPCVIVDRNGSMLNSGSWNRYQNRDKEIIQALSSQFEREKTQIIKQQQNALDKYRGTIYTSYKWREAGGWFGHNFVSDVYDDGRWTYIRVNSDNKGVMSICGCVEGKNVVLQFSYDETTKMYRVSGIYPKLTLAYGKDSVVIERQNI
ncbi:MAG: TrbG/VirB9 family P-type conjugative transfer protein [Gammaproteobacteria bacterium]